MAVNIYSLAFATNIAGQFATNVFYYQFDDGGFSTTFLAASALNAAWETHCTAAMQAMTPTVTNFLSVKSRRVTGVGGFEALSLFAAGVHGLRGGNVAVAAVSPLAITYQALNGKLRGKTFLPGACEGDVQDGIWSPTYQSVFAANATALIDNLVLTGGGGPTANRIIYSRKTKSGVLVGGILLSLTVGTQRRRQLPF